MCEPVTIGMAVGAVVGGASSLYGSKQQAKYEGQMIDAQRRQQHEMIRTTNWQHADDRMAMQDANESTRAALTEANIERLSVMSALSTAISESGMGGRSMDRLQRVQNTQFAMQESDTVLNYQRDYEAIFSGMVGNAESTKRAILGMAPIQRTSKMTHGLNAMGAAMQGASLGMSFDGGIFKTGKEGDVRKKAGKVGTNQVGGK